MLEAAELLEDNSYDAHQIYKVLEHTLKIIDWTKEKLQPALFLETLYEAQAYLNEALSKMKKASPITVNVIGHTHIDLAWLWRIKHTREKAARSFATVLRLMEQYPEYIFVQSQPQIYAFLKEDYLLINMVMLLIR